MRIADSTSCCRPAPERNSPGRRPHRGKSVGLIELRRSRVPIGLLPSVVCAGVPLPARRATRAVVHGTVSAVVGAGIAALIAAALGVATWVATLIVAGVIGVAATLVVAYALSRP
jgi:hypothetical protein